jgi:SAM-dependent methyltransferase
LQAGAADPAAIASSDSPWHEFARRDPYTYILTGVRSGDSQQFWETGEIAVSRELLPIVQEFCPARGTAVEIGCGVGRLIIPLARHFQRVVGIDISPEMIRQARQNAQRRSLTNIGFHVAANLQSCSSVATLKGSVDFLYSLLVFQHIEEFNAIEQYLQLVSSWLSPAGAAYLQFDTRKPTLLYDLKNVIPDRILPRYLRRGIRRIRREPKQLEQSFTNLGLTILKDVGRSTMYHRYVLKRS